MINGGCRVSFGRVFEGGNQREVSRKESGFLEKRYPPPPQTLTGDRLSREGRGFSTKGRKALVLSLKLAINRVSWSSGGGGGEEARCSLFSRLI